MAVIQGHTGEVQIADVAMASVSGWTYRTDQPPLEYGILGDINMQALPGARRNTGTVSGYYDPDDPQQTAVITASETGTTVSLQLYPEGDTSSNVEYTGDVTVTDMELGGQHGEVVSFNFSFYGALTRGTVS